VISEPLGGAHRNIDGAAANIKQALLDGLRKLAKKSPDKLIEARYRRLMAYGKYNER